ncbi:MAG TPA: hypothetical protein VFS15_08625, partial [Kofleriaceae bacterium]|nr:hypothetical protein [Kofleriaceae bacterium]
MAQSDRERARRILEALRALPSGTLDTALAHAYGSDAVRLAAVRAALADPDPEAALAAALRDVVHAGPSERMLADLGREANASANDVSRATRQLGELARAQRELSFVGRTVRDVTPDPELRGVLDEVLSLLGDAGPFAAVKSAVAAASEAHHLLADIARGNATPDEVRVGLDGLRTARSALDAARDQLADVSRVIDAARRFAAEHGDSDAEARLAVAEAALAEGRPDSLQRWQAAFDKAIDAQLLPLARAAATRIQLLAIAAGEREPIIDVANRLAALARTEGDQATLLEALGDQALALAQLGQAERARQSVLDAKAVAGDEAMAVLRTSLLDAQVSELLGDAAAARKLLRQVMQYGRDVPGSTHLIGWAALHLGRLEAA